MPLSPDDLGFLTLGERKGKHVRRTVDSAVGTVQFMDMRIVRQRHAHLGILRTVEPPDRQNRTAHRRRFFLGHRQRLGRTANLNLHVTAPASFPTHRTPRQCASRPRDG